MPPCACPCVQDELVAAVAAVQPRSVAVVTAPGAVLLPFADAVAALLLLWLPGQEAGHAAADVLFGFVNPSGRLPVTLPFVENEVGFTVDQFPGVPDPYPFPDTPPYSAEQPTLMANYSEGLEVGYRWYHARGASPRFPFGFGLSYTAFAYSGFAATSAGAEVTVTNTGTRAGSEVAQLYLTFPASANEPPVQLKGFSKVYLEPGHSSTIQFHISQRARSIWDLTVHDWTEVLGTFEVHVGSSSHDLRMSQSFIV